ncbi:unnamed protein product [Symbiodinium natans]|uniref:Ubiquitin-like domain-containing protein n=1 Tax=Symbiodinium natans TaxID=878477 RepID=A0A812QKM2_9DINO|nr:unnamed protein product [Symbiodinium natans]
MLTVCGLAGQELATLPLEEMEEMSTVRNLKQHLGQLYGIPRFRQRLLHNGKSLEDTMALHLDMDLQVVFLHFSDSSREEAAELTAAVEHDCLAKVEEILQRPQDPNLPDANGNTPLTEVKSVEIATLLLEAGACKDLPSCDSKQRTALGQAVQGGNLDIVKLLLELGADMDLSNGRGTTPLMLAAAYGQLEIASLLLQAGVNADLADDQGITALMIAAVTGDLDIGRLLLEAGVNKDFAYPGGPTALMFAAREGQVEFVRLLLEAGATKDLTDNRGKTAAALAVESGHVAAATLLSA